MFGSARRNPEGPQAARRVKAWTRERFKLPQDAAIVVSQLTCALPGCPPLETVIVFWTEERRHHLKIFKPLAEVLQEDLPPGWLRDALAVPEDYECGCC